MTRALLQQAVEALKPCPFCGGAPSVIEREASEGEGLGRHMCFISCYCDGYSARAHQYGKGDTPAEGHATATAAWNRRAPALQQQEAPRETISDERILHLWDTYVGYETAATSIRLDDSDKLAFARAVLYASSPSTTRQQDAS